MLYSLLNTLHTDKIVYTYVDSYILITSKDDYITAYILSLYVLYQEGLYVLYVTKFVKIL